MKKIKFIAIIFILLIALFNFMLFTVFVPSIYGGGRGITELIISSFVFILVEFCVFLVFTLFYVFITGFFELFCFMTEELIIKFNKTEK